MKCPKCGYNSFEFNDSCKKCSNDLSSYKQTYGITSIILPLEAREKMAEEYRQASAVSEQAPEQLEQHDDMFSFDLPEESAPAPASPFNDDPFNFDDDPLAAIPQQPKVEEDGFADLLESTSLGGGDPFGAPAAVTPPKPEVSTSGPGEFDLENFSWDDTPVATAPNGGQSDTDDFDSLFGDANEHTNK